MSTMDERAETLPPMANAKSTGNWELWRADYEGMEFNCSDVDGSPAWALETFKQAMLTVMELIRGRKIVGMQVEFQLAPTGT
jgi:hypothetical protein